MRDEHVMHRRGDVAETVVERADAIRAVALERHPELDDVGAARTLEAAHSLIPHSLTVAAVKEVRCALRERRLEHSLVSDEQQSRRQGKKHHLVRIPGDRPRVLDAAQTTAVPLAQERGAAMRGVHMEPDPVRVAECADRLQIVERACRRGPRGSDDGHHRSAVIIETIEHLGECAGVHGPVARRHHDDVAHADPQLAHGARHGVMRVHPTDHDGRIRAHTIRPHIGNRRRARGQQSGEGCLGAATRERPSSASLIANEIAHPSDDAVLEHRVIRWMCDLVGYPAGAGGTLTSGGTEATFTALLAARAAAIPDVWTNGVGANPPVVICGVHTHYAVSRAVGELGIGMRNVIVVPTRDWAMNTDALAEVLDRLDDDGRPVMAVVATAGTTATGSFDDLQTIGALCDAHGVWLHVDAAHGGSALLSQRHRSRLRGIEHARSIAWDPHKIMLLPLAAGLLLVRDERVLESAFSQRAPYLFHGGDGERVWDQGVRSFQCSRRADVIKLWVALQRYGANGLGALYDRLCDVATAMHDMLVAHPSFAVLHVPTSNILCFRYVGDGSLDDEALDVVNRELRERYNRSGAGWITATELDGRRVLRVTIMNPRTSEHHVREIVEGLAREAASM